MERKAIIEILEKNVHKSEIQIAIELQDRLSFFVETYTNGSQANYLNHYFANQKIKINNIKSFEKFKKNTDFPLPINEFTESLFANLFRIFEGQNSNFKIETSLNEKQDFDLEFYKNKVWEKYKTAPNTLIALSTIGNNNNDFAEIEKVLIDINRVVEFQLNNQGDFEYLIFRTGGNLGIYTSDSFSLYPYTDNEFGKRISKVNYDFGFCPVDFISNEKLNLDSDFIRSNIIVKSITSLEDLLRIQTFKKILNPHAFFLFIERFAESKGCDFENQSAECSAGIMHGKSGLRLALYNFDGSFEQCPKCNEDMGVGNELKKSVTFLDSSKSTVSNNIIKFVSPETDILEYGDKFILSEQSKIEKNVLGKSETLNSKLNHNEDAYQYNSESQEIVILRLKSDFETVIKNIETKVNFIKYRDFLTLVTINLGTEFLLAKIEDLYLEKEKAKELGLDFTLDIDKKIINTKFKTDNTAKERAVLLNEIYPAISDIDLKFEKGFIPGNTYYLQIYFNDFINWFESNIFAVTILEKDLAKERIYKEFDNYLKIKHNGFTRIAETPDNE